MSYQSGVEHFRRVVDQLQVEALVEKTMQSLDIPHPCYLYCFLISINRQGWSGLLPYLYTATQYRRTLLSGRCTKKPADGSLSVDVRTQCRQMYGRHRH